MINMLQLCSDGSITETAELDSFLQLTVVIWLVWYSQVQDIRYRRYFC